MSFSAERAALARFFNDLWQASEFAAVPVHWENHLFEVPDGESYVAFSIVNGDGRQRELAGPDDPALHRYGGHVQIDVLVPEGEGTAQARAMADVVSNGFRRQWVDTEDAGSLTFHTPVIRNLGTQQGRCRFVVSIRFTRDIVQ